MQAVASLVALNCRVLITHLYLYALPPHNPTEQAASLHPYDAVYNPGLKQQLAVQQQYYTGPPAAVAAASPLRGQYAPSGGGGGTAQRQMAQQAQRKGAGSALDPRAFAPLGAAAAGLQRQSSLPSQQPQQQRRQEVAAAGAYPGGLDPRYYRTIG